MSSVAKPRTILDYVERWEQRLCKGCQRFLDTVWIPYNTGGWSDVTRAPITCTSCRANGAPPQERAFLERLEKRGQQTRAWLGLGDEHGPTNPALRRALGGHWGGMTLFTDVEYRGGRTNRPPREPKAPRARRFMLMGFGRYIPADAEGRAALAPSLFFETFPARFSVSRPSDAEMAAVRQVLKIDPRIVLPLPEHDPVHMVLVHLGALVNHPAVHGTSMSYLWSPSSVGGGYTPDLVGNTDIDPEQYTKLYRAARTLLEGYNPNDAGRPHGTGTYGNDAKRELLADLERVLGHHEREGRRINNMDMLADYMPIGRTQLYKMFKKVPEASERFKQHKRRVQRLPRD